MKLSELSLRDYIAMEVFPSLVGKMLDKDAAWRAFTAADEFLKRAGREHELARHEIDSANRRAEKAEAQNSLLFNMDDNFGPRVALTSIWEFLGVDNQTAAMTQLQEMKGMIEEFGK